MVDTVRRAKELADARGWTMYKLCRLSGVPYSTLASAKRRYNLSVETIELLCKGFQITLSEFFEGV